MPGILYTSSNFDDNESSLLLNPNSKEAGEDVGPYGIIETGRRERTWASRRTFRYKVPSILCLIFEFSSSSSPNPNVLALRQILSAMAVAVLVFVFVLTSYTRLYVAGSPASTIQVRQVEIGVPPEIQNLWGAYTPYFPAEHYQPPPYNCKINQVCYIVMQHFGRHNANITLSRHQPRSGQHRTSISACLD
jgi:hypothetical protein